MQICVVVLTWNGTQDTLDLLASLDEHVRPRHSGLRVLVVDNASTDDALGAVVGRHPWARTLQTGANLGYGGGNNAGVERALADGADVVVVLNNDTLVTGDWLAPLLAHLRKHPTSVCSPDVRYADDPGRSWFEGGVVQGGIFRHASPGEVPAGSEAFVTPWLSGCCFAATAATWRTVGPLDAWFFLIQEDCDWSMRARACGATTWVVPESVLLHRVSSAIATQGSVLPAYYWSRNGVVVAFRHLGPGGTAAFVAHVTRELVRDLKHGRVPRARGLARGLAAGVAALPRHGGPYVAGWQPANMITLGLETIPGWFWGTDVAMFEWFLGQQESAGVTGDLAEMGCYLGRSAVLVGAHLQPGETFTVVDLFEDPAADGANSTENDGTYRGLSQAAFEANYRRVHGTLPVVVRGFSQDVTAHAAHGSHRFVHIDASHLYDHVKGDIAAARALVAPDAVVVFDDIREAHTPGVWAAFWEAVVAGDLLPIAVTEHKMYATWGDAERWQERLLAAVPAGVRFEEQGVLGRRLVRLWTEPEPHKVGARRRAAVALTPPAVLHRFDRARARHR